MQIQHHYKIWIILGVFMFGSFEAFSQASNIGNPPIFNYLKKDYKGSPQNWDVAQSETGIMYFANSVGLLEFDGVNWSIYKVDNQTVVRSVEIAENGNIFVGAQGEIGYFSPSENGSLQYQSLNHLLENYHQNFADVWDIEILEGQVFFGTGSKVMKYEHDKIEVIYDVDAISHVAKVNKAIYVQDQALGLLKLKDGQFEQLSNSEVLAQKEVIGLLSFGIDTLLITTNKDGFYLYSNGQINSWTLNDKGLAQRSNIYAVTQIDENQFAIGTSVSGVFIFNKRGKIIRHIDRKFGLQVNNVLSLFTDRSKNLWAGLDNGIDFIETSSPFTFIYPDGELKSTGYAIKIHEDQIYFGTSSGVYTQDWRPYYNMANTASYELVKNSDGQVWNLSIYHNELILNHHEGTFKISDNKATRISDKIGSWMQIPLSDDKLLSGHYNGLSILEWQNEWKMTIDFADDWKESCRILVQDENETIWVSHPYRGAFRVKFNADYSKLEKVDLFNSEHGLPSDLQVYVFKIGDEAVFCAERGVYSFDELSNRFVPNKKWNNIFGENVRVRRLIESSNGDIWFVADEAVGVLRVKDGGIYKDISMEVFPQLMDRVVNAFEEIYPYDENNVFIAQETGFIHYNPGQNVVDTSFNVLIRKVQLVHHQDSILFGGNISPDKIKPKLAYDHDALLFSVSANHYGNIENNQFQFQLDGYDEKWSAWSGKSEIEYTNLKSGNYTFRVRAKNINNTISSEAAFAFEILPPWYATKLGFALYFLLFGAIIFFLIFIPKQKFEREKAALETRQQKKLQQKDQEYQLIEQQRQQQISKLEKEKLQLQIQSKNQELASNTMHLVQKSEILQSIKEDIQKIAKNSRDEEAAKQLKKIIKRVSADERLDSDWAQFAQHFDQVHSQFLKRLQSEHPQLTPKDHRLCAYLRMNLSSKEMAPLMNISVRSVEVARYRLRKKLDLNGEINLVEFMLNF